MPNAWIQRTIQSILTHPARQLKPFSVWILLGPRQVGKTSVLQRCSLSDRQYINLDDLNVRTRATADPFLFLKDYKPPVLIDEIQYAPQLLSGVKMWADKSASSGSVWITGSQNFKVMKGVQESLAGRAAILNLFGLSDIEKQLDVASPSQYFEYLIQSTFPKMYRVSDLPSRELYLSSYIQTYIERDVSELLGIQKRREFELFLKMCALRTAQLVNYESLSKDVGVSPMTIKEWLSLLEDSFLIKLVQPFYSNKTKRLIKSPKLYFLDMGLAAYLAGWKDSKMLHFGPMGGAAFETHILGNIVRYFRHRAREVEIYFWRSRDGEEIDFLIEAEASVYPIEVKIGTPSVSDLMILEKIREPNWKGGHVISLISLSENKSVSLNEEWKMISPHLISNIFQSTKHDPPVM